jgi:hypothetical protein
MIVAPASSPTPTPAPTLASVYGLGLGLQPRQTDYLDYDSSCYVCIVVAGSSPELKWVADKRLSSTMSTASSARPSSPAVMTPSSVKATTMRPSRPATATMASPTLTAITPRLPREAAPATSSPEARLSLPRDSDLARRGSPPLILLQITPSFRCPSTRNTVGVFRRVPWLISHRRASEVLSRR